LNSGPVAGKATRLPNSANGSDDNFCDRIIALADRKVIASGPMSAMLASQHPWLRAYFHGKRARRIESALALQPNEGGPKEANGGGGLQGRM
jgi:phospholipid/cholesterol/gamma-HCH transport system ATP-binding protein